MNVWKGIWCVCMIVSTKVVLSQCPESDAIILRVIALRESQVPFVEQKKELLGHLVQYHQCPERNDSALVHLLQRTGALSYLLGQYQDAVFYTNDAIQRLKDLAPAYSNIPLLVKMYHYLNIFYDSLQLTANKISAIDSSVYYAINNGLVNNEILNNIMQRVEYSYNTGDYIRCINDAKIAKDLNEHYGSGEDSIYYAEFFFNNRINSMIELKDLKAAEIMVTNKINELTKGGKRRLCGPMYNQLSRISVRNKKYADALNNLILSYECNRLLKYSLGCKQTLNNIGFTYYRYLDDPGMAHQYYGQALSYNSVAVQDKDINMVENVNILGNIANVYVRLNRFDSAFLYFDWAFSLVGKNYNEQRLLDISDDEFSTLPNIHYLTSMVRDKADAYLKQYRLTRNTKLLNESISTFRIAHRLLMRIKQGQKELLSQLSWRKNAKTIYEHAIEACYEANSLDDAFYFFEKSRSMLLIDRIAVNRLTPPETLQKIARLDMRIQELNMQADQTANDSASVFGIRKKIYDLTREKDMASRHINKLFINEEKQVTFRNIKNRFKDNAILLEIFVGDTAVYIMTVAANDQSLAKVGRDRYEQLASAYIQFLGDVDKMNREYSEFIKVSHSLYRLILKNIPPGKKLIVSPDGKYFPFEALVVNMRGQQPQYLVEFAPVSYTYSAQYLNEWQHDYQQRTSQFLGMAPVKYHERLNLTMLPQSDASLNKIGAMFKDPVLLTAAKAERSAFLERYFKYEVVQLYTHATETDQHYGEPVIYFADSALRLSELVPVETPATRIIILSACETGSGRWHEGEGVFSFNRSFAELGVPSAMVNLWSVDNQSTYRLNELFSENLARGISSDVALQQAKIKFIKNADKEHQLPFYWAAPIISGHVISLRTQHTNRVWWYGLAVFVIAGMIIVVKKLYKKVK
jgi:CHAT domain-containing protein